MYLYTFTSNLFCTYYRSKLGIPLIITETCNTWLVSSEDVTLLETCNHQNCQTCVTVWQTSSDCCNHYWFEHCWKEYPESLLQFCTPPATYNPVRVAVIMDTYGERIIKNQKRRGQSGHQGRRIFITESEQSMPQGKSWSAFLSSGENKTELIRFLVEYYKSQAVRCIFHQSCSYIDLCNII